MRQISTDGNVVKDALLIELREAFLFHNGTLAHNDTLEFLRLVLERAILEQERLPQTDA